MVPGRWVPGRWVPGRWVPGRWVPGRWVDSCCVEGEGGGVEEDSDSVDGVGLSDPEPWVSPDAPDPLPEAVSPFATISLNTEQFYISNIFD